MVYYITSEIALVNKIYAIYNIVVGISISKIGLAICMYIYTIWNKWFSIGILKSQRVLDFNHMWNLDGKLDIYKGFIQGIQKGKASTTILGFMMEKVNF